MSRNITFNIYVMSYRRPNEILSERLFEYCTYVVREEEAEAYRKSGVKNILAIPPKAVFSFMSTLYWIIENTPEDVIFVADDDILKFYYRTDETREIELQPDVPDTETITAEVERIAQLLVDLRLGFGIDDINRAPYSYNQEFVFKGVPGHVRWINKPCLKAKYDKKDLASGDVDMMMQELMYNRIILKTKYFVCRAFMDTNDGAERTRKAHYAYVEAMKAKWGRYYGYNYKKNTPRINVDR